MKILKEKMMLNDLNDTLNLTKSNDEILIQRSDAEPIVLLTLEKYNELKAEIYRQTKK